MSTRPDRRGGPQGRFELHAASGKTTPGHSTLNCNTARRTNSAASCGLLFSSPTSERIRTKLPAPFLRAFGSSPTERFQSAAGMDPTTSFRGILNRFRGRRPRNTLPAQEPVRGRAPKHVEPAREQRSWIRGSGRVTGRKPADSATVSSAYRSTSGLRASTTFSIFSFLRRSLSNWS